MPAPAEPAPDGWLVLDKDGGVSSARALARAKRLLGAGKAGHAGTLDPLATGVLPLALGEATKTVRWAMDGEKAYRFRVRWGESRDTLDADGEVTAASPVRPGRAAVEAALPALTGALEQVPPRFSALRVGGRRAYDRARAGEAFAPAPRRVEVREFRLLGVPDPDHADFLVRCGKGTYVRSLARDLARALGAEGHVARLRRTRAGPFREEDAVTLAKLAELVDKGEAGARLLPLDIVLDDIPAVDVTGEEAERIRSGRPVRPAQAPAPAGGEGHVVARCAGRAVAVGELRNRQFAPRRVFRA